MAEPRAQYALGHLQVGNKLIYDFREESAPSNNPFTFLTLCSD